MVNNFLPFHLKRLLLIISDTNNDNKVLMHILELQKIFMLTPIIPKK